MSEGVSFKRKTFGAIVWLGIERYSNQIIAFILQIFIARILMPSDYGFVGMVTVFTGLASIFIDSGFSIALMQKTDRTEADCNTVFYFNLSVSVLFYLILFFCAPLIAKFYGEPVLIPITRMVSISLITNATTSVHYVVMASDLNFKPFATVSFISTLISGLVGIYMAYHGFGLWTIVWQSVIRAVIYPVLIWIVSRWRPKWMFSWDSFHSLFSFGGKILLCAILDVVYGNLYNIVIGKKYNHEALGYYTRAQGYANLPVQSTVGVVQGAMYPAMCSIKEDKGRLLHVFKRYLKLSSYIFFPIMVGLAAVSEPLVVVMITEKWLPIVPMMQVLCLAFMWNPLHSVNLTIIKVEGLGNKVLFEDFLIKATGIFIVFFSSRFGTFWMCVGTLAFSQTTLFICSQFSRKVIRYGFLKQFRDILPALLFSLSMGILVHFVMSLFTVNVIKLIVGVPVGILFYVLLSIVFRNEEYQYLYRSVKLRIAGRR